MQHAYYEKNIKLNWRYNHELLVVLSDFHNLQEFLTIKSDDVTGRAKSYEAIVKREEILQPGIPESFRVLIKELQSLGLAVEVINEEEGLALVEEKVEVPSLEEELKAIGEGVGWKGDNAAAVVVVEEASGAEATGDETSQATGALDVGDEVVSGQAVEVVDESGDSVPAAEETVEIKDSESTVEETGGERTPVADVDNIASATDPDSNSENGSGEDSDSVTGEA